MLACDAFRRAAERAHSPDETSLKIAGIFPGGDKSVISDFSSFVHDRGFRIAALPPVRYSNNAKLITTGLEIRAAELHVQPILHTFLRVPASKYLSRVRSP